MTDELFWLTADELRSLYRSRELSPVEVVDASLDRLEQVNPAINAFVSVTADLARTLARGAEKEFAAGSDVPDLFGIPISVKDLTETAGVRTTFGSTTHADHVPDEDALEWARLKAAGVILVGKTTTPEFGLLGVTESKLTGITGNPWNPELTAGGSSGGAAASTVSGIVPLAWGSDGGGSIRVPASVCGAVGIKPTIGRIAHSGCTDPDCTDGPLTRSVVDAAMLLDVTVGPHATDRYALPATGERYAEAARQPGDLMGLRIAFSTDLGGGPVDPETRRVFTAALDELRALGALVEEVEISLPDPSEHFIAYWGPEYIGIEEEFRARGVEIWPMISDIARRARTLTPQQVSAAVRETRTQIYQAYAAVFRNFDLLACPTTPFPAFPHVGDAGGPELVDGQKVAEPGIAFHRMTESPSHAGLPAISVPCGFTVEGLPVGLQMIGPLYADVAVVTAAARYERASGIMRRHPVL